MPRRGDNTQLFALSRPPEAEIAIGGAGYRLVRVFKHDFFAATSLYEAVAPADIARIVVKFYRTRPFCGLPAGWLGRLSRDHERAMYATLANVEGVPRWVASVGRAGCAIEYVEATPLDRDVAVPPGYFDRLGEILTVIHARGVAYVDANKRSNILIGPGGRPYLVDFQIAVRRREDWPWPLRAIARRIVRYLQGRDVYHFCKHKRRMAPGELTSEEAELSCRPSGWHWLHRKLAKPYRAVRRRFLHHQYRKDRLVSPTADMEGHCPPEQQTWKKP